MRCCCSKYPILNIELLVEHRNPAVLGYRHIKYHPGSGYVLSSIWSSIFARFIYVLYVFCILYSPGYFRSRNVTKVLEHCQTLDWKKDWKCLSHLQFAVDCQGQLLVPPMIFSSNTEVLSVWWNFADRERGGGSPALLHHIIRSLWLPVLLWEGMKTPFLFHNTDRCSASFFIK